VAKVVAETARLRLREWDGEDEARFFDVMNRPEVMRYLGGVQTREEWRAAYRRVHGYQTALGFTFWIVEDRTSSEVLGFCGLKRANAPGAGAIAGDVEIGWRLRPERWGEGIAKEAAIASLDLAFERFDAPHVVAVTAAGNLPSQGLMKRLGMRRRQELDFIDARFPPDSEVNPQIVFVMDSGDWPAARAAALA
jgi:RimJ/RimL family protein N-acetyltransferase